MSQRKETDLPLIWRIFKIFGDVIWDMRAPLIMSIAAFIVFSQPPQVREVYRVLALEIDTALYRPILTLVLLAGFSYLLWSMSRAMWANSVDINPDVTFSPLARAMSHVFSMVIALLPIIGVLIAMTPDALSFKETLAVLTVGPERATSELSQTGIQWLGIPTIAAASLIGPEFASSSFVVELLRDNGSVPPYLKSIFELYEPLAVNLGLLIRATAVLLVLVFLFLLWRSFREGSRFSKEPFAARYFIPVTIALGLIIAMIAIQPIIQSVGGGPFYVTWLITGIGSLSIITIFFIFLTYLFSGATRIYDSIGIPAVTILVGAALIFATLGWNDNHRVRLQDIEPSPGAAQQADTEAGQPKFLFEAFSDWYESRPQERIDKYAEAGEPYPVYIVTARGGGAYAANLAAITLSRLYTACPALRHHVFAISAVSGGSLGASVFNSFWLQAAQENAPEVSGDRCDLIAPTDGIQSNLEKSVRDYLGHDFFSPVLAGALFPDFLQRFIVPGFGTLDRARAFEASLNHAWMDTHRLQGTAAERGEQSPFEENFLAFSRALRDEGGPTLVLNTTSVETGERFAVAPFNKGDGTTDYLPLRFIHPIEWAGEDGLEYHDISLATAIGLSSRFPFILPPGNYPQLVGGRFFDQRSLVDGGYFESSAIDTAVDLVNALQEQLLALQYTQPDRLSIEPKFRFIVLNDYFELDTVNQEVTEFGAPVVTLDRTRLRRGELAEWRVQREDSIDRVYLVELVHGNFDMPLGLHLSKATQSMIAQQIGFPSECMDRSRGPFKFDRDALFAQGILGRQVEPLEELVRKLNNNRCILRDIITELEPG